MNGIPKDLSDAPSPVGAELSAAPNQPLVRLQLDAQGRPSEAIGAMYIAAPPERVWQVITEFDRYPERVPMIHHCRRQGDQVTVGLRFRVSFFSTHFEFTAAVHSEPGRMVELRYLSGEPEQIRLRFDVEPAEAEAKGGSLLHVRLSFDMYSLGWLVKYFLRQHPEIQFGVFSGSTLVLLDAVRRAAR